MSISRRKFLAGRAAVGALSVVAPAETALARRRKTVTLTAVATRTGEYPYLPEIAGGTVYGSPRASSGAWGCVW